MPYEFRNILVVDDESPIHEMYEAFFKPDALLEEPGSANERDFEVFHAYGGQEAIDTQRSLAEEKTSIQVAFVDLKMEPIDGVETIKSLNKADSRTIFVVVTGLQDDAMGELLDTLDGVSIQLIPKPFEAGQIYNVAVELCGQWNRNYAS